MIGRCLFQVSIKELLCVCVCGEGFGGVWRSCSHLDIFSCSSEKIAIINKMRWWKEDASAWKILHISSDPAFWLIFSLELTHLSPWRPCSACSRVTPTSRLMWDCLIRALGGADGNKKQRLCRRFSDDGCSLWVYVWFWWALKGVYRVFSLKSQMENRRKEAIKTAAVREASCESNDAKRKSRAHPGIWTSNPSVLNPEQNR